LGTIRKKLEEMEEKRKENIRKDQQRRGRRRNQGME